MSHFFPLTFILGLPDRHITSQHMALLGHSELIVYLTGVFYTFICLRISDSCPLILTWHISFSISCKVGPVVIISLSYCLGISLPSLHSWRTTLQGQVFWLAGSPACPTPVLWIYHPTLSWPARFLLRRPLVALWGFLSRRDFFFLDAFKVLSLSLILDRCTRMCFGDSHFRLKFGGDLLS